MDTTFFEEIKARSNYLKGVWENRKSDLDNLSKEVETIDKKSELLAKTEVVLKHLIDKLVKKDLSKMDRLVTYGLETVFPDKNLKFQSVIRESRGKIKIELQTLNRDKVVDSSSKSSVSVIESLLLRIICILKLKKARLLLLDETFPAVDTTYIENVSKLLSELSEKLSLDILAVTHIPSLSEKTKNSYKLVSKNNSVTIEKVK